MNANMDADASELKTLGRSIDQHIRELEAAGQFSEVASRALRDARVRRDEIQQRLDAAIARGDLLTALKSEVLRDFNVLRDALAAVSDQLEVDATRTSPDEPEKPAN